MFNFNGQTKRRNINLATTNRNSKKDLIVKAKQEREKRAIQKLENDSVLTIQRSIRRVMVIRDVISRSLQSNDDSKIHLIPLFGKRLLSYVNIFELKQIVDASREYSFGYETSYYNVKLLELLGDYADDSMDLVKETLQILNPKFHVPELLIMSLAHMLSSTKSITDCSLAKISQLIKEWHCAQCSNYSELFVLKDTNMHSTKVLTNFYRFLALENIFPEIPIKNPYFLKNICLQYKFTKDKLHLKLLIAEFLSFPDFNAIDYKEFSDVSVLFDGNYTSQILKMMSSSENNNIVSLHTIVSYVSLAKIFNRQDPIIILLLSKKNFVKSIYDQVVDKNNIELNLEGSIFFLFLYLIEVYLLVTTDQELLNDEAIIEIKELVVFTAKLRDFVFNCLWDQQLFKVEKQIMEKALDLLRHIYLRDSRLKFCTTKKNPTFWSSNNEEFLQVNIFKCLDIYEKFYREYIDMHTSTGDEMEMDQVESKTVENKFNVLELMKTDSSITLNTRQLKKFEILIKTPFFIPFEHRVDIFYTFIAIDRHRLSLDSDNNMFNNFSIWDMGNEQSIPAVTISRENSLEDAYKAYNSVGEKLKSKISVNFVNEFGPEAGIDGGGITKEFLTSVTDEGFRSEKYDIFKTNYNYELYPNPSFTQSSLNLILFLGKIIGKCLYDRVLVDVRFAEFFMKKILNYYNKLVSSFDDLSSLDNVLYQNLVKLLSMTPKQIEELDLTFEITDANDTEKVIQLIPNGSNVKVTKNNILKYIFAIADMKLNKQLYLPCLYFSRGMGLVIAPHWMEMFNSVELQMLISGGDRDINVTDLHENTIYGGYDETDQTIIDFWDILTNFEPSERVNFIKFVTSVPKGPLQGFKSLNPKFGIRNSGNDKNRLPTASTCVNLLKLPDYKDKRLLKEKLLYAINSGARFDLS